MADRIVIAGASGVIGSAAVAHFARAGFEVVALSRRRPLLAEPAQFRHVSLDLADEAACAAMVGEIGGASHLVYAAVAEEPGLVSGWTSAATMELNSRMFANLAGPLARNGGLGWVGLLQGTKAYGAHLHPIALPAREDAPRDPHANFYFLQEDCMRALAGEHGLGWTVFRPQVVLGGAPGAAMNPVAALGAYAAICRKLGLPFAYPARARVISEITDAALLADALIWAAGTPEAHGQIFNVTNGDIFVLRDAWEAIAQALGLEASLEPSQALAEFFAAERAMSAWREIAGEHGLLVPELEQLLGQSHHYVDLLVSDRMAEAGRLPALVSIIKIREAGFTPCRDSLQSMLHWLRKMGDAALLPGMIGEG